VDDDLRQILPPAAEDETEDVAFLAASLDSAGR